MWAQSSQSALAEDDLLQLEELFRKRPAKAKTKKKKAGREQRRLFEIKRENNVAIALVKLKKSFPDGWQPLVDAIEQQHLAKLTLPTVSPNVLQYMLQPNAAL